MTRQNSFQFSKTNRDITKLRSLIKLMAYSGLRLSNSVWMLNTFEKKLEFKENFARYPFNLPYRTKKMFFAYMPIEFGKKLKKFSLVEGTYRSYGLANGIVLSNQLRKPS
ncbi:MAG: integrase [Archaeoglobaceae archaeon]